MTQAGDLGQIANQARTLYRGRVNVCFQAMASFHEGPTSPSIPYAHMIWADNANNLVKQRNSSNTAWNVIGTIDTNKWTWTNIDQPLNELTTGDVKITFKNNPDPGWVMVLDRTIGDGSSGGTERANVDCKDLFQLIWGNISEPFAPVQDASGNPIPRGTTSLADWSNHRRLVMSRALGRALGIAGSGSGLSVRSLGSYVGEESHLQSVDEMPSHKHAVAEYAGPAGVLPHINAPTGAHDLDRFTGAAGGGKAFNVMQPTWFINLMCKL